MEPYVCSATSSVMRIKPSASDAVVSAWNLGQLAMSASSSNFLGVVRFTVPATATAGASYSVSFANADGAPDFFTQYNFETRASSVWVSRSAPAPLSIVGALSIRTSP